MYSVVANSGFAYFPARYSSVDMHTAFVQECIQMFSPALSLKLAKVSLHVLKLLKPEKRPKRSYRSVVFSHTTSYRMPKVNKIILKCLAQL